MDPANGAEEPGGQREHPLRRHVVREMHLRRFPAIEVPARLVQTVRIVDRADRDRERSAVTDVPAAFASTLSPNARHFSARRAGDGTLLSWEAHTEASTATMLAHGSCEEPFEKAGFEAACWSWMDGLPGLIMRSTRVVIVATEREAEGLVMSAGFDEDELVSCHLGGGARLWSDFRLHGDHGRLVIAAGELPPSDLGRTLQRVQELGNYRNLALLGLPVAQAVLPRLQQLEEGLAQHARDIASHGIADENMLLLLSTLTAELAAIASETGSRMSATEAYSNIATDRLASLGVRSIPGYMSLTEFTDRRLVPAVRTCSSFVKRLEQLSERAAWITSLLRATIETHIERQNRDLLRSVEENSLRQLRLQHFVERLSLVALSYYAIGIVGYAIKGSKPFLHVDPDLAIALAVPVVILGAYAFVNHRMRRMATKQGGKERADHGH